MHRAFPETARKSKPAQTFRKRQPPGNKPPPTPCPALPRNPGPACLPMRPFPANAKTACRRTASRRTSVPPPGKRPAPARFTDRLPRRDQAAALPAHPPSRDTGAMPCIPVRFPRFSDKPGRTGRQKSAPAGLPDSEEMYRL